MELTPSRRHAILLGELERLENSSSITKETQFTNGIEPVFRAAFVYQNNSRMANCIWREVVAVEVIWPAFGRATAAPVPEKIVRFGSEKFRRFSRLKNSARNCRVALSPSAFSAVSFISEKSKLARPGPRNILRPAFPKNPTGGRVKALGS